MPDLPKNPTVAELFRWLNQLTPSQQRKVLDVCRSIDKKNPKPKKTKTP